MNAWICCDSNGTFVKRRNKTRTMIICDRDICICQIHEISGSLRDVSDPITILIFRTNATIVKSDSRPITRCLTARIGHCGIHENHAAYFQYSHQQCHENRQGDGKLNDRLRAKTGGLILFKNSRYDHQNVNPKYPSNKF